MLRSIIRKVIVTPFIYSASNLLLLACQEFATMQALRFQQQKVESPCCVLYSHVLWSCQMQNRYILFVPNLQIMHKDLLKVHCRFFPLVQKLRNFRIITPYSNWQVTLVTLYYSISFLVSMDVSAAFYYIVLVLSNSR